MRTAAENKLKEVLKLTDRELDDFLRSDVLDCKLEFLLGIDMLPLKNQVSRYSWWATPMTFLEAITAVSSVSALFDVIQHYRYSTYQNEPIESVNGEVEFDENWFGTVHT